VKQGGSRVVGYVRVSTDEQAREGVSLASQTEKVRLFAALHELELVDVIADAGVSAKTLDRPGLARALALLDTCQADGLVVVKLDRLTRSVGDLARLLDRYFGEGPGKLLFSVGDSIDTRTAAGRLVLNVLMSVSQWERETICERTRTAVEFKRTRGERIGTVPYGSILGPDGRSLIPCPAERSAIAEARQLATEGRSLRAIAAALDASGVPPKSGGRWSASTIRSLLLRDPSTWPSPGDPPTSLSPSSSAP
jgi:DNA invertase Pin-like site-specific DNA recombinase